MIEYLSCYICKFYKSLLILFITFQCSPFVVDCLISLLDDLPIAGFLYNLPLLDVLDEDPIVVILLRLLLAAISAYGKTVPITIMVIEKSISP